MHQESPNRVFINLLEPCQCVLSVPPDRLEPTSRYPNCEAQVHVFCPLLWLAFLCRPPRSASQTSSQLITDGGQDEIYTRPAHNREERG